MKSPTQTAFYLLFLATTFFSVVAFSAPPRLLSLEAERKAKEEEKIPIPEEATPQQMTNIIAAIEESRAVDVSVTDSSALLYKGLMLVEEASTQEEYQKEEGLTNDDVEADDDPDRELSAREIYRSAQQYLEECIRRDPSRLAGWEGLGWAYIKVSGIDKGMHLWKYFQRLMPEQSLPYTLLAQGYSIQQDWVNVDINYRKSLSIDPKQYEVRYWYAQNLLRIGKTEDADRIFRDLIEENPDRTDIQLDRAALLAQHFQYEDAVEIYRRVNEMYPGIPKVLLEQAILELRVGELRAADQLCIDIISNEDASEDYRSQAMRLRANIAEIDGMNDLRPLRDVINETEDPVQKSLLQVRLAVRCQLANQRQPGTYSQHFILGLLEDAVNNNPTDVGTRVLYAERLVEAGRLYPAHEQAEYILEKFNRHNTRAKMVLFEVAIREKRYEDAEQILADRYTNYDGSDPMAYYYRARIESMRGMYQEALKEIDKMEAAAQQGCVLTLLYHDLTESDWTPVTSTRRLHEHISSLQREGWILISPTDIPKHIGLEVGESRNNPEFEENIPATARLIDYFRWCFTGTRKFKKAPDKIDENKKPPKYFAITFDDELRSALILGTDVAQSFGVPFGYFVPTKPLEEYTPSRAGWEEVRTAAQSGYWVIGSELYDTFYKKPVDAEGEDIRNSLPNRIWLEDKNRQESMNEWDRRMRFEFRESRRWLKKELGVNDSPVPMVSYPYGDIGQEASCNLQALKNPMQTILSEAARTYRLGFIPSESGYTVAGDNLLLVRRHEPSWTDEGADVVRHAYENHPIFIARKFRAQVAMLMNRPNLAQTMVDVLRRDGYPEELCRQMETELHAHFQNKPNRGLKPIVRDGTEAVRHEGEERDVQLTVDENGNPIEVQQADALQEIPPEILQIADLEGRPVEEVLAEREAMKKAREAEDEETMNPEGTLKQGSDDAYVDPYALNVGAELHHTKANDQIEVLTYGLRAGMNLNENTTLNLSYFLSTIKQTVRPHWNAQVITNVPFSEAEYKFRMEGSEWRIGLNHRMETGAMLYGSFGQASKRQLSEVRDSDHYKNLQDDLNSHKFVLDESETATILTLGCAFNPTDTIRLNFFYDRNYVSSAVKNVTYDSVAGDVEWNPEDSWLVKGKARYWSYEDDNAMFSATFDSLWNVSPDNGVWAGFQYSTTTVSDGCDFYWTPYWDNRVMAVIRYEQAREGYHFRFDLMCGTQGEKTRNNRPYEQPMVQQKGMIVDGMWTLVEEERMVFIYSQEEGTGWHRVWGISSKFEKELNSYLYLTLEAEIVALRMYIDHFLLIYLKAEF